ncbi:DMT family transporter [Actinophytocola gossypii]|uniref:EamA family transporter n=1 Tax=Actinophytocola gossypii TaxID=2812003 RepID=A0ABT2JFX8_9PSEU|nr:EamA family transporter [Actinophytocola gossypii]MCT2586681.1 EamA family transporter [Actinophytocola gossypii]
MLALPIDHARTSTLLLALAGVLWGTGGLAGDLLQDAGRLDPVPVATYRLLVGGLLATAVTVALGQVRHLRGPRARRRLLVTGLLLAEFQAAYQIAVERVSVSLATLVTIGCVPVFVAAGTAWRERRLPAPRTLTAIGTSLVGLALLSGSPVANGDGWQTVSGVGAALLAGAGFATLTLVTARPIAGQAAITSVGLLVGGVMLTPFALGYGMGLPVTAEVLVLTGYLGVVPTAVAYGAYVLGLRHATATAAALATMLEPLTATLLAVAFHGETLTAAGFAGAALIGGAVALAPADGKTG